MTCFWTICSIWRKVTEKKKLFAFLGDSLNNFVSFVSRFVRALTEICQSILIERKKEWRAIKWKIKLTHKWLSFSWFTSKLSVRRVGLCGLFVWRLFANLLDKRGKFRWYMILMVRQQLNSNKTTNFNKFVRGNSSGNEFHQLSPVICF